MKKRIYLMIVALIAAMPMVLSSCGGDDEPDGPGSGIEYEKNGPLIVNGLEWEIGTSAPNFNESQFVYWCVPKGSSRSFIMMWEGDLNDVRVGDDVSTDLIFPQPDCRYEYLGGSIEVVEKRSSSVTLKFNNVRYRYSGDYLGIGFYDRDEKYLEDQLTVSGTVKFIHNQTVVYD